MYVCINNCPVRTLMNSGAQVPITYRNILSGLELKVIGSIYAQGVLGDPIATVTVRI